MVVVDYAPRITTSNIDLIMDQNRGITTGDIEVGELYCRVYIIHKKPRPLFYLETDEGLEAYVGRRGRRVERLDIKSSN